MIPRQICINISSISEHMNIGEFTRIFFSYVEIFLSKKGKVLGKTLVTDNTCQFTIILDKEFIDKFEVLKSLGMSDTDILYPYIEEQITKGNYHES